MARITTVQLIDDIDGKVLEDGVTVRWGLDGKEYEIDTSSSNADAFRKKLDKYINASRRVASSEARRSTALSSHASKEQLQAVREWASANGYTVSARGRIPRNVVTAFEAAH